MSEDRENCLHLLIEAMDGRMDAFTAQQLNDALIEWALCPIMRDGRPVAVFMARDEEVHVAALKGERGKWLSRKVIKECLGPVLAKHGCVTTRVSNDNHVGVAFVERLGFKPDTLGRYRLERLHHA